MIGNCIVRVHEVSKNVRVLYSDNLPASQVQVYLMNRLPRPIVLIRQYFPLYVNQ